MANTDMIFTKSISITAATSMVWEALTIPEQMQQWMSEMPLEILTEWKINESIIIKGHLYKKPFENRGKVLAFECPQHLSYTHLSSISRLDDVTENYCVLNFRLSSAENSTVLQLSISNFPTEIIYRHLAFYWNVTLEQLKKFVEQLR
ncbi:MAG: SRPBCC domain-containing protein [Bacteroidetes bacterium]|nr:SRPBCC domain-containing protein [Bacteroidota bacterium]